MMKHRQPSWIGTGLLLAIGMSAVALSGPTGGPGEGGSVRSPRFARFAPRLLLWKAAVPFIRSPYCPKRFRIPALRKLGVTSGRSEMLERVMITGPNLELGTGVFINVDVVLHNVGGIVLGDNVAVGPGALFTTTTHEIGPPARRPGKLQAKPIHVGNGSWIGARAVILPGVTIGEGCVIAAGAVVVGDCGDNGVYMGVPARRVRDLD